MKFDNNSEPKQNFERHGIVDCKQCEAKRRDAGSESVTSQLAAAPFEAIITAIRAEKIN